MVSVYDLKPRFQQLLKPLMRMLLRAGVTPNEVTVFAVFVSLCGGMMLWAAEYMPEWILAIPVILFLRMTLNALDGMMARETQHQTPLGEIFNEVGDVVSDAVLYFPLIFFVNNTPFSLLMWFCFIFLSVLCEFSGVLAKSMTGKRRYDGPMGKSDRALFVGLYCLVFYFWPNIEEASFFLFAGINCLLVVSSYNRLKSTYDAVSPPSEESD